MDDTVRDLLLQLVVLLLIWVAFFMGIKEAADPEGFFLRFYAEDVGTTVDALHAADGRVELDYMGLHPDHAFIFRFDRDSVRLATQANTSRWVEGYAWWRADEPRVRAVTLDAPAMLGFSKDGMVLAVNEAPGRCAAAVGAYNSSRLVLQTTQQYRDLLEARPAVRDWLARGGSPVTLTVGDGNPAVVHSRTPEAQGLACLLQDELAAVFGDATIAQGSGTDVTLTVTMPPTAAAAGAVARALERGGG